MHMADALISPAVGGTMWAVAAGLIAHAAHKVRQTARDNLVPMMGVLGAFVFAVQMLNFSIPGTGSSGHLGGGLLLTILLGPHAALLTMASILTVQALFFADGGLLALGCNIFNLGFFPAFVAYPLIYRPWTRGGHTGGRAWLGTIVAAVAGLLLGAFAVVVETKLSGISALPFATFAVLMLPIHLAIGLVEGLATASVVTFVVRARPEAIAAVRSAQSTAGLRPVLAGLAVAALLAGGVASWFASTHPDGLEWSIAKVTGKEELEVPASAIHERLGNVQEKTALLPDYDFRASEATATEEEAPRWPAVSMGTSVAGLVGSLITLALVVLLGLGLRSLPLRRASRQS